jgi:hypothetical protein
VIEPTTAKHFGGKADRYKMQKMQQNQAISGIFILVFCVFW